MMKLQKLTLAASLAISVLTVGTLPARAVDGILFKVQAGDRNYCHLKFPAIRADTLHMNRPVLQNSSTGEIIDFYGPCDYDPTGKDAVQTQRNENFHRLDRSYNND